jgi:hypothetical protein
LAFKVVFDGDDRVLKVPKSRQTLIVRALEQPPPQSRQPSENSAGTVTIRALTKVPSKKEQGQERRPRDTENIDDTEVGGKGVDTGELAAGKQLRAKAGAKDMETVKKKRKGVLERGKGGHDAEGADGVSQSDDDDDEESGDESDIDDEYDEDYSEGAYKILSDSSDNKVAAKDARDGLVDTDDEDCRQISSIRKKRSRRAEKNSGDDCDISSSSSSSGGSRNSSSSSCNNNNKNSTSTTSSSGGGSNSGSSSDSDSGSGSGSDSGSDSGEVLSGVQPSTQICRGDRALSFLQDNPKIRGSKSFVRYEKYKHASSLREMKSLGGSYADFTNDCEKGFCVSPTFIKNTVPTSIPGGKLECSVGEEEETENTVETDEQLFHSMSDLIRVLFANGLLNPPGDLLDPDWRNLPVVAMFFASGFKMPSIILKLWRTQPLYWTKSTFRAWVDQGSQCSFPAIESFHLRMRSTGALSFYNLIKGNVEKVIISIFTFPSRDTLDSRQPQFTL